MAHAPTAEIAEPSFAALVAAMQQLTLALNTNIALMSNASAMSALNASSSLSAPATAPIPTAPTVEAPAATPAPSPTAPAIAPSPASPISDGIHPDDVVLLPEIIDGPAIDSWYTVIVGVTPGVYHDWVEVGPLVNGISGVVYRKVSSKAQALDMYAKAWYKGQVRRSH